jgi:hypothetical protein
LAYTWSAEFGPNFLAPHFNLPFYGAGIDTKTHECTYSTFFPDHYSQDEIRQLAITSIQMGIDFFHALRSGADYTFFANAGFGMGRLIPVLFAAALLGDPTMEQALLNRFDETIGQGHELGDEFSEDGHIQIGVDDLVLFCAPLGNRNCEQNPAFYWGDENGVIFDKDCADPEGRIDGGQLPGGSYMLCCSTSTYIGAVGGLYVMPSMARLAVGVDGGGYKLFDYAERINADGVWTQPDPEYARFQDLHGQMMDPGHVDALGNALYDTFASWK